MRRVLTCAALSVLATSTAMAADLPTRNVAPIAPVVAKAPEFSWTGAYIGASAGMINASGGKSSKAGKGGKSGRGYDGASDRINGPHSRNVGFTGGVVGAQAGYNYQTGPLVLGLEADINRPFTAVHKGKGRGARDASQKAASARYQGFDRLNWYATLRPRIGVAVSERVMLYGTGGLAMANVTRRYNAAAGVNGPSRSSMRTGWTVGAGVEYAMTDNLSLRGEYNYISIAGKRDRVLPVATGRAGDMRMHVVRVGLNYKF